MGEARENVKRIYREMYQMLRVGVSERVVKKINKRGGNV